MRRLLAFVITCVALGGAGDCWGGEESIAVTSPNGSERWLVGETRNITWTATLSSGVVKIEYSSNGGTGWSVFKSSTPNDGSESWTIPNIPSAMCLVRISDASDGLPLDVSDSWFRIEPAGSWPFITTKTSGEVFVSFVGGDSAADSEIGFGYASATTPPGNRYILFQDIPDYPSPTDAQTLGFMPAGSGLDFYVISLGVSAYSGSRPNESFSDIDGDHGYGDTAVTVISTEPEAYRLWLDRATGGIDDDNDFIMEVRIVPVGESPPVAVVQTPSGVQSGNVCISYTLKDIQGDVCTIEAFFSQDGGVSWSPATPGPGGDGMQNLSSSQTGQNHVFVWDSVADIGLTDQSDIRIRITPWDAEKGTPGETHNFRVDNMPPPELSCSPDSFAFEAMEKGSDPASQTLEVWNSGSDVMDWQVDSNVSWLTLNPESGQSVGEKDTVTVSVSIAGLVPGTYNATITVSSQQLAGQPIYLPVTLTVHELTPLLSVSPNVLSFTAWEGFNNPPAQDLAIQNAGGQPMPWQVSKDMEWLSVSPESGSSEGEIDLVEVSVDVAGLTAGSYAAHIQVTAQAIGSPQWVTVLLEVTEPPPLLLVSPGVITITCTEGEVNPPPRQINVRNAGTGEFSWTVSDDADWLSLTPESGDTADEVDVIEVRVQPTGLSPGTYQAKIMVTATTVNSPQQVDVTLVVEERPPTLWVSPTVLRFLAVEGEANPPAEELKVKNAGRGEMDWKASEGMDWLELSVHEGTSSGEEDVIEVTVVLAGLEPGLYNAPITITSTNAVNSPVSVMVQLEVAEAPPMLGVSPDKLVFSATQDESDPPPQEIEIENVGGGELTWGVSTDSSWLSLAPTSGTNTGEKDKVTVSVRVTGLAAGTYTGIITVTGTTANSPQKVSVELTVAEPPPSVLSVTPLNLDFSTVEGEGNPAAKSITVQNTGGREMEWTVSSDKGWLSALPTSGSSKGEADAVQVFIDVSGLSPGTHTGSLVVSADALNSPQTVQVTLTIEERPAVLSVSPLSLSFVMDEGGPLPAPQSVRILNTGGRAMDWQASVEGEWLRVSPEQGTNTGSEELLEVSIASEGIAPGNYIGEITVEAPDAENSPQTVSVTLVVKMVKLDLTVSPERLEFSTRKGGGNPASKIITITTNARTGVTWLAEENATWLRLSRYTDTNQGEEDLITVSVQKGGLEIGTYECDVSVQVAERPTCMASVHVVLKIEPIRVPGDEPTIQAAIDAAQDGDVILVAEGTYTEKIRMKSNIEVIGEGADKTVLDCAAMGTAVAFEQVKSAKLEGITITGGTGERFGKGAEVGGGIYMLGSSPVISRCRIANNSAAWGGGICLDGYSAPVIVDCEVCDNSAASGAGFFCYEESSATIVRSKISGNSAEWYGGGMYLASSSSLSVRGCELRGNTAAFGGGAAYGASDSDIDLVSCTVVENSSPEGAAVFMEELSSVEGINCILWGNTSPMFLSGRYVFRNCDTEEPGLTGKNGNISADPRFAWENDYHLLPCSPCIDMGSNEAAGLPSTDLDNENRIMAAGAAEPVTDIGADEVNPDMPIVVVEEVSDLQSGRVRVTFGLFHLRSAPCGVVVEYTTNGGENWRKATRAADGEGTFGLSSSPTGEVHSFVWDSVADEGGVELLNVLLRITPESGVKGSSRMGRPFSIDNRQVDTDNDKLPDAWEQIIIDADPGDSICSLADVLGDGDFDGDGRTNRKEYLAGTNPVDGQSSLRVVCVPGQDGKVVVSCPSIVGKTYLLLYCDGLANGWHPLGEAVSGTGDWIEFPDATAGQAVLRFYKVEAE